MNVHEYIKENWKNVIRENKGELKLPKPYTVPCKKILFINFFYWDTYFTNLGLMRDGMVGQVKNNLDCIKYCIDKFGYMPNADHLINRTQPPLFTRGVYDYYKFTGNKEDLAIYIPAIIKELEFFEKHRMTSVGLYRFGNHETEDGKVWYYHEFDRRIGYTESERKINPDELVSDMLTIAESGWDFNPRFGVKGNRFASEKFAHLDLNCLIYDAEIKLSEMLKILGDDRSEYYEMKALNLKKLIEYYMLDSKTGIFFDYNIEDDSFSKVLSCASFYPYFSGISSDTEGFKKVYQRLMLEYGLSACEYRSGGVYLQWDYPTMWPSNMYFAYVGAKRLGLYKEADIIREKYINVVDKVFFKTGDLWEKYDVKNGDVSKTSEYETPSMMGWTAGVYRFFEEEKIKD